jgi:hypothetical protein
MDYHSDNWERARVSYGFYIVLLVNLYIICNAVSFPYVRVLCLSNVLFRLVDIISYPFYMVYRCYSRPNLALSSCLGSSTSVIECHVSDQYDRDRKPIL